MNQLQISKNYGLRSEKRLDQYLLYHYTTGEIINITGFDSILLSALAKKPLNLEALTDFLDNYYSDTEIKIEDIGNIIEFFIKKNIITAVNNNKNSTKNIVFSNNEECFSHFSPEIPTFSFPLEVEIFLTKHCNMNCVHCSVNAGKSSEKELPLEFWKNIFDQIEQSNVIKVTITGGEPTLFPYFWELIDYIKLKKIYKCLLTNALFLNDDSIITLRDANIVLGISLDGACEETHDSFRKTKGAFSRTIANLNKLNKFGKTFDILSVIHKKNLGQIEDLFLITRKYKARSLSFNVIEEAGRGKNAKEWFLTEKELDFAKNEFSLLQPLFLDIRSSFKDPKQYVQHENNDKKDEKDHYIFCRGGNSYMAIDSNGIVYSCPYGVFLKKMPMGNSQEQSLRDIWKSKNWNLFRGGITIDQLKTCRKCEKKVSCELKTCRMRSMAFGDDPFCRPYNCPMN